MHESQVEKEIADIKRRLDALEGGSKNTGNEPADDANQSYAVIEDHQD
jgi:hypothetical protein